MRRLWAGSGNVRSEYDEYDDYDDDDVFDDDKDNFIMMVMRN